jgi:hypothetical protein
MSVGAHDRGLEQESRCFFQQCERSPQYASRRETLTFLRKGGSAHDHANVCRENFPSKKSSGAAIAKDTAPQGAEYVSPGRNPWVEWKSE